MKAINKFWAVALMNHPMVSVHAQHNSDQAALSYLEDLWIVRDPAESRCFTLEFVSIRFCWTARRYVPRTVQSADGPGGMAVLQGEPVLLEHGAEEAVQVRPATCGD